MTQALHSIFAKADPLPTDNHTRLLLRALLAHPDILAPRDPVFLVDRLKALLREGWEPDLVHDVVAAMLERAGCEVGDIRSAWAGQAGGLVDGGSRRCRGISLIMAASPRSTEQKP